MNSVESQSRVYASGSNLPLVDVIGDHRPSQEYAEKMEMAFSMIVDYFQNELPYIRHGLEVSCIQGYVNLANSTDQYNHSRLLRTLDAFGKLEAGLLEGNVVARGNYDECLDTGDTQYCLLTLDLSLAGGLIVPTEAICIPVECTVYDIEWATGELEKALALIGIPLKFNPPYCTTGEKPPYSAGAVAVLVVCSLFLCLIAVGTLYDMWLLFRKSFLSSEQRLDVQTEKTPLIVLSSSAKNPPSSRLSRFLVNIVQAFSLYKTLPAILSTAQPPSAISCINGMRVISMFWVIMGHVYVFASYSGTVANPLVILQEVVPSLTFQGVENALFAVDTFFFLSGLLTAYLTLREMHRRKGRFPFLPFYIHRYLRLTPSIAFVLFFFMFMTVYLSDGPYYSPTFDSSYNSCRSYWWTNLLYINNFYPSGLISSCIGWTWYLANDMQFFVVSPLMLILLYHSFPVGLASVGVFLVSCLAATAAISAHYKFAAGVAGQGVGDFIDIAYTKPYCRIFPYLVGLLLGYLLYKKFAFRFKSKLLNLLLYLVLWALAAFFCLSVVYGLYGTLHGHPFNEAENVLYLTFSRLAWGIGLALVVFACHNGYGWVVNSFLSMGFWVPLSRLTFNAYLVHPIVLTVIYSSLRTEIYYTTITVSIYIVAAVVLSYAVAGVIAVCVEFPISNVEMAVFELLGVNLKSRSRVVKQTEDGERA